MMRLLISAAAAAVAITGCASASVTAVPAQLVVEPDAAQTASIQTTVRKAMGRNDLALEPATLAYNPELVVRPVAVEGMTDRVPGIPTRLTLMMKGSECWLSGPDGMRIDMPDMACRAAR